MLSLAPLLLAFALPQSAVESVEARITSVGLFKNGLAVVRRSATLPSGGRFEVDAVLEPVHGTFSVESDIALEVRTSMREVEVPFDGRLDRDPQRELAGCTVELTLRDLPDLPVSGRVVAFEEPPKDRSWSRTYEQNPYGHRSYYYVPQNAPPEAPSRFLAIDTLQNQRKFVDISQILHVSVEGTPRPRKVMRPLLELVAPDTDAPIHVDIVYLSKGLSYAPALRVDMRDGAALGVVQDAVLRNELEDLHGVEIELISGFPSIDFAAVVSPLAPSTDLATFFAELARRPGTSGGRMNTLTQAASNFAPSDPPIDAGMVEARSEGVDLHYHSIGKRDLKAGESLALRVADASSTYERIVEWLIPDTRDESGRIVHANNYGQEPPEQEGPWDAVRFANPFDFPLTTSPASIFAGARFLGQRMSSWVNPGQTTTLPITKALSVRAHVAEYEAEAERELIRYGGYTYRKVRVEGELWMANHRSEALELIVRREFSGELVSSDDEPRARLLESGVYSVNRRRELRWTLTIAPGEERTVKYAYDVLVRH